MNNILISSTYYSLSYIYISEEYKNNSTKKAITQDTIKDQSPSNIQN
jgi:hypothetical protein